MSDPNPRRFRGHAPNYARINPRALGSTPYFYRSPGGTGYYNSTIGIPNGAVGLVPSTNDSHSGSAFGILQPMVFTAQYFSSRHGYGRPEIEVLFDEASNVPGVMDPTDVRFFSSDPSVRGHEYINIGKTGSARTRSRSSRPRARSRS